ncbi:MAG: futalosine hydrolase [Gaiellales bacterium]|jgi:futalosine hydrolase|nr:futalosine hydrolase [Gaiellales bacterium]
MGILVLVPTEHERSLLPPGADAEVCGFGLAAAGAGAAHAIALHRPDRVVLVGAAGTLRPDTVPVGAAVVGSAVRCDGIGVGSGPGRLSAAQLGWAASDEFALDGDQGVILSVAAASADPAEAKERAERHEDAVLEEMEGYAVAVAATLAGVPLTIIRGVSNIAGDRDAGSWRLKEALQAAHERLITMVPR